MICRRRPTSGRIAVSPISSPVALVVGMHGDRDVGQHRLGADGRDRDRAAARCERVVDVIERVGDLAVLDLQVGDRRAAARIPVDQVPVAVDVALVVERDEHLASPPRRSASSSVKRSSRVVAARRRAACSCPMISPPYCSRQSQTRSIERLPAERLAARALGAELLLDLLLGRDSGVVGAEDPLVRCAAHAVRGGSACPGSSR